MSRAPILAAALVAAIALVACRHAEPTPVRPAAHTPAEPTSAIGSAGEFRSAPAGSETIDAASLIDDFAESELPPVWHEFQFALVPPHLWGR